MNLLYTLATVLVVLALLLAAGGLLYRGRRSQQAGAALQSALDSAQHLEQDKASKAVWWRRRLADLAAIGQHFDGSRVQKALLAPEDRLLLEQVGWNQQSGTAAFLATRVLLALLLPFVAMLLMRPHGGDTLIIVLVGFALGILLPKLLLRSWAARLRRKVDDELPLLIDLLRLLQGVGFSIDQSLQMVGEKLHIAIPVLGKELQLANAGYSRGRSRAQSLRRLSESFDNDDLRSLMQMVLQVHQHGGAVQEPLKQFGMRLREQRRMKMKEKVGKLSVKMTVVMMITLLPALMLVLAGPAIISLAAAIKGM
ncbi:MULTISPECIES: type II secretion system F family protein [Stenotrophomonas]|uniref:type II secretion system F family protein n=1 Tax=Stenotrophomonas TaxID=40323 RepID=UPI0007706B94|nr:MULTISPECIES: type II secretion system F family protein [Stenotrophomonas]AMJ57131.1 transmembrane type II secretion protein [Stenotrophomonas sp. KCTC 12332]